jgi:hypothetical protein
MREMKGRPLRGRADPTSASGEYSSQKLKRANPESLTFDIFEHDAEHAYAVYGSLAIYMWRGAMQEHHPAQARDRWAQLRDTKGTFGVFVVILPSAPPPPLRMRNTVMQAYHSFARHIRGVGTVLEDQGVRGAAGAMAMTAIMLMSKPPYAYRNDTNVAATAAWLAKMLPEGMEAETITRAVEQLRSRYTVACESYYSEPLSKPHTPWRSLRPR